MQTKLLKDRPTLFGGQRKILRGQLPPLPHAGYGPGDMMCVATIKAK